MADRYSVGLGQGIDEQPIRLTKEDRDVHMQVVGLSRQGKSFFLEHLIRQDIQNGAGVCVIDPHGELYDNIVDWCIANDMHKTRRIHLINPSDGQVAVGFNPLCINDDRVDARVDALIDACQKVWDDSESTGHKTLAKLLKMVFLTLAHHRLSLREATLLTTLQHEVVRDQLVSETGDDQLIDNWSELAKLKPADYVSEFKAINNRLFSLTRSPGVAQMLGQTDNVIDFKTCMDNGHIVLVNLKHQGKIPSSVARTIGALITADLFHAAQCREIAYAKTKPFYCYIDECGDYLNETIVKGLDQTAKFGLHYILSHQGLDQLGDSRDDPMRRGIMRGAQNKVVFLQDDVDSATELADRLFGTTHDLETPKQILIKPAVVRFRREWFEAEGWGDNTSTGKTNSSASGSSDGMSSAISMMDIDNPTPTVSHGLSSGNSSMKGSSDSESHGTSYNYSRSEGMVPELEDLPGGLYPLEELRHLSTVAIRMLKKRQAYCYGANERVARQFVTADVFPARPKVSQIDDFYDTIRGREKNVKLIEVVEEQVQQRRTSYLGPDEPPATNEGFFE